MSFAASTLSALVALVFLLAGAQKVLLRRSVTANLLRLGVGPTMTRSIGVLEVAGALGLAAGLWFKPQLRSRPGRRRVSAALPGPAR